jgi:hypothetical protein
LIPFPGRHFLSENQADPLGGLPVGVSLAPLPQEEPEEALIADARDRLTPSRMVDQKLLALMRSGNPGLYRQATGAPPDIRGLPQGPHGDHLDRLQRPDEWDDGEVLASAPAITRLY